MWKEFGERARQAEQNDGIDWKALSHAYRGGVQLLEIYTTGDLKYPLREAGQILEIKKGNIEFKLVQQNLESVVDEVEKASAEARKNGMPSQVDMSFWDDFVEQVYLDNVKDYYGLR